MGEIMYLMFADTPVLYFDFDDFVVDVINEQFLPYSLFGKFSNKDMKSVLRSIEYLKSWLSRRLLSLSRSNAKQIYAMFGIPQANDIETRTKVCITCKGVSIQDNYWIACNEHERFADINIRHNHFKEILDISLLGLNPTVAENGICPELTTQGLFRKCWVREDSDLYLLKSDNFQDNISTRMEVLASKILSCFQTNIATVEYTGRLRNTKVGKLYVSKCKNFVTDDYAFVEAWEVLEYCRKTGVDFRTLALRLDKAFADIPVLDFIIMNTDRHTQNYGFLIDKSNKIVGLAPIFDFNCALVSDYYNRQSYDTLSQMFCTNETIISLADQYKGYCSIKFDKSRFEKLRGTHKEYRHVFDRVAERCKYLGL